MNEAGATGLEPATSRLTSERSARLSYAPERGSAGGIRTHDLELMRLARTAAPLPRSLAGRSRTCDLRRPKPVGWPAPLQPEDKPVPPAGFEPAASGLRARRHHPLRPRGRKLRRQDLNLRLASNSRVLPAPPRRNRRRQQDSNLRAATAPKTHPFSRRGTAPVAVLPRVAPAGVEPAPSRVRTGSSAG